MPGVLEATDCLRVALLNKSVESHVQDAFDNLASCLVLLNSSSPSVQMIQKLRTVLRQPFLPLYNTCLQPALRLSSSILSVVLTKLCDTKNAEDESVRAAWDTIAEVILSGVLDFLDQNDSANAESRGAIWDVLCRIICDFFFLDSGRGLPAFSIRLCLSAYNTLTETAARQVAIRNALCQRAILGGERLGAAISGTRDYLLLEALLLLFARLLPPTLNSQGKIRRIKFLKDVFGCQKLFKCSAELLDIMQKTSGIHWDEVAAQIIDVLARSDITYPQPFSIDEIRVCGRVFPQPLATDRLIVDKQAFLANVVVEDDDVCESLQVPYSRIRTITLDNLEEDAQVSIMVHLVSPPLVANVEMKYPDASHLHAKFLLRSDAVGGFMEALRRRGVGKLNFLNPLTRVNRKRKSISIGSGFKFTNDSSPIPPPASFEGKIQHVNKVYKTDIEGITEFQTALASRAVDTSDLSTPKPKPDRNGFIPPASEESKPIQKRALRCLLGASDELSEISEFEVDSDRAFERAETKVSASSNRGLKPIQPSVDRMWVDENPSSTSEQINESSEVTSRPAGRTGATRGSPGTEKSSLILGSPIFGATSSTQIDVSPKALSQADTILTMVGTEVADRPSLASHNFVGAYIQGKRGGDECGPFDTTIASAGKPHVDSNSSKDAGQHIGPSNAKLHSGIEIMNDMRVPIKLAGSRRKREAIKSSNMPIIEVDDEHMPSRKKSRRAGAEEDKAKSNENAANDIPAAGVKKYMKTAKRLPVVDPATTDFGERTERKPTAQGTRRSSRIKKRQTAATGGARANATRGKTQKVKLAVSQSASGAERRKLVTALLQDANVEIGHRTRTIFGSHPTQPMVRKSPSLEIDGQVPSLELSAPPPEANLPREMLEVDACAPRQPSVTPTEGNLAFVQEVTPDPIQPNQEQSHINNDELMHDRHPASDVHNEDKEDNQPRKVIEYSVSLKESPNAVEPPRPVMASPPRKEIVTIDLTGDDSPTRENSNIYESSMDPVRSERDVLSNLGTPELEEPSFVPSSRHKRRSVTFASPIEYMLDKKVSTGAQTSSSRSVACSTSAGERQPRPSYATRSCPRSPSDSSTLSPLRIPTRTRDVRHESPHGIASRVTLQNSNARSLLGTRSYGTGNTTLCDIKASVRDETADEVGIHDIVEVLNEIQSVIIKGISDKFKNARKGVQRSQYELVQQVLDELRGMIIENAKYFNGLLSLEDEYYKTCKTIIRCWEDLMECNDELAVQFQNILKRHDQNLSARSFPRSLLPMQPVFSRGSANTLDNL